MILSPIVLPPMSLAPLFWLGARPSQSPLAFVAHGRIIRRCCRLHPSLIHPRDRYWVCIHGVHSGFGSLGGESVFKMSNKELSLNASCQRLRVRTAILSARSVLGTRPCVPSFEWERKSRAYRAHSLPQQIRSLPALAQVLPNLFVVAFSQFSKQTTNRLFVGPVSHVGLGDKTPSTSMVFSRQWDHTKILPLVRTR